MNHELKPKFAWTKWTERNMFAFIEDMQQIYKTNTCATVLAVEFAATSVSISALRFEWRLPGMLPPLTALRAFKAGK